MPRNTRAQNRQMDEVQRHVITQKPMTITGEGIRGGFIPAAAIPFIAAAATPLISKGAQWIGHKIFGNGILQSGASRPVGFGIMRSGDKRPPSVGPDGVASNSSSAAGRHFRSGDIMMPSMIPVMNYKTGAPIGMSGGMLMNMPGVPDKVKSVVSKLVAVGGKKKAKKSSKKKSC